MTPLVVALAIAGVLVQWLGLLSNPNLTLVAYATGLLISTAWAVHVVRAKRSSSLVDGVSYPTYSRLHRTASVASALVVVAILVVHATIKPKAFVPRTTEDVSQSHSEAELIAVTVTAQGLDIKLKNSGADTAFVHELWLALDDAKQNPTPCAMLMESTATYDYPFTVTNANSTVDAASFNGVTRNSKSISRRLIELLESADQASILDEVYWAAEPLNVSQAIPPRSVDRLLIKLTPSVGWRLGSNCDGGIHYNAKIILAYDKSRVSISQSFRFTLVRAKP